MMIRLRLPTFLKNDLNLLYVVSANDRDSLRIGAIQNLVDNYIYILNVRFSGEIHYEKEVDESLLQISMPSMILQPIVENCVNHGIREKAGEGRIRLRIYRIDDVVCISIKDNGVGMSQEMIDKILHGWEGEKGSSNASNGIGMDNVIARLRLFQGTDDVATVISEGEGMGTEVILYLQM